MDVVRTDRRTRPGRVDRWAARTVSDGHESPGADFHSLFVVSSLVSGATMTTSENGAAKGTDGVDGTAPGGGAAVGGDAPAVRARRRACGPSGDVIVTMRDHAALAHRRSFVVVCELRSFGEEKDG